MDCKQQMDGFYLQRSHRIITSLVLALFLQSCRGQPQLIGPSKPIVARIGDDITLPCYLKPATMDVTAKTLEWTRTDLDTVFVFVWRAGREFKKTKHSSYKGRTSLFTDELRHGNMSLKLSNVNLSDKGTYKCYIVEMDEEFFIDLVVASDVASSPVISLAGTDVEKGEVTLQCKSAGWYPEPELLWWDGEGNLLSAGPTVTLRGADGLYTVSSRVTVEKRHSNSFTCRVSEKIMNQNKDAHFHVSDDFFMFTRSSAAPIIIGLAVSLALSIIVILFGLFFIWRQNKTKVKRGHCDEAEKQEMMNRSKNDKTETEQEQENLMKQDIMPVDRLMAEVEKLKDEKQQLQNLVDAKEQKHKPLLLEKNQAADKKLKDTEELKQQLKKKQAEIRELKKQLEKIQEADKKMKEEEDGKLKLQLQRKSSRDKEKIKRSESSKLHKLQPDESLRHFQEQNQSSSANHSLMRCDIILEELDRHGCYLCLKNNSREDKFLGGWELKLQIKKTQPVTYKFKENYTLRAGRALTLRQPATRNPHNGNDDLVWEDMPWCPKKKKKIDLISNTGEQHTLK